MKDIINIGDKILAQWTGEGRELEGIVQHIPQDTGDMWIIICKSGAVTYINPNCSSLETINKIGGPIDDQKTGEKKCETCNGKGSYKQLNTGTNIKCESCGGTGILLWAVKY